MLDEIRETVYEHVQGNDTFTVTAAERSSIAMLRRLKAARPEEVEIVAENEDGSILAHLPYSWMRIVPKKKVVMSEEQKRAAAERMRAAREKKEEVSMAVPMDQALDSFRSLARDTEFV